MDHDNPFAAVAERNELQTLDEELNDLPERIREPLVLRYLMGRSNRQIADELGLTEAAVESRLKRGREKLRKQLARRGIGFTAVIAALELCRTSAAAAPPAALVDGAIRAGLDYTSAGITQPHYSQEAASLAANEVSTMTTSSLSSVGTLTIASTVIIALAIGLSGASSFVAGDSDDAGAEPALYLTKGPKKSHPVAVSVTKGKLSASNRPSSGKAISFGEDSPIEKALETKTHITLLDSNLTDAIKKIETAYNIKILPLTKVLQKDGVDADKLLTHDFREQKLSSILNIILAELEPQLTYVIEDEVLKITTVTDAEERLHLHVYDTSGLNQLDPHMLKRVIYATTHGPWADNPAGGEGIGGSMEAVPGGLVIRTDYRNHKEIRKLLRKLSNRPPITDAEAKRYETRERELRQANSDRQRDERLQRIESTLQRLERRLNSATPAKAAHPGMSGGGKAAGGFF